ncbi:hypothetical protein AD937_09500 [Gluconobacter japonicus]|nr:hypothetical protein AD937_09500 [Gluconobacter japonicus]
MGECWLSLDQMCQFRLDKLEAGFIPVSQCFENSVIVFDVKSRGAPGTCSTISGVKASIDAARAAGVIPSIIAVIKADIAETRPRSLMAVRLERIAPFKGLK